MSRPKLHLVGRVFTSYDEKKSTFHLLGFLYSTKDSKITIVKSCVKCTYFIWKCSIAVLDTFLF